MPTAAPLVINIYGEDDTLIKSYTRAFIPWKMLKKAIAIQKQLVSKTPEQYEEEDIDALTNFILSIFGKDDLTVQMIDDGADVTELIAVIQSIVSRAKGIADPTLPPRS